MRQPSSAAEILDRCSLFAGLPEGARAALSSRAHTVTTPPQKDIFVEGQPCDGLWVLGSGRVRLYHTSVDGRQQVVAFRAAGSALELGPALDGRQFTVSAAAPEGGMLAFLPRGALHEVAREPSVVRGVLDQLCIELRNLDISNAVAALKDARSRVYCALLRLAAQFGVRNGGPELRIDYRLARRDIADISGVTLETAIRVLSDLQRQGILRTDAQILEIVDVSRLQKPCECVLCQLNCGAPPLAADGSRTATAVAEHTPPGGTRDQIVVHVAAPDHPRRRRTARV